MNDPKHIDRIFNPKVVAVIGAKQQNNYNWLRNQSPFTGKLYSVQLDEREIPGIEAMGITNHKSLVDIPEEVDLAIVVAPRAAAIPILRDAIAKKVGGISYFTSGFGETGTEEGVRIQETMVRMAREGGINIVGPNCMGIYSPRVGVRFGGDQPAGEAAYGHLGVISQSGTHASAYISTAYRNGIKVSKAASIGNSIILDAADFLDYLGEDDDTRVVAMYLEGVQNGRRFFEVLRKVSRRKPVIIFRGGQTEDGRRGAASHTGSLAFPSTIWQAAVRQTGAVAVDSLDEAIDAAKAFTFLRAPQGDGVACLTGTGGPGVVMTDAWAKAGFRVPPLNDHSYGRLEVFYNVIGGYFRNPLDIGGTTRELGNLETIFEILDEDDNIDLISMDFRGGPFGGPPQAGAAGGPAQASAPEADGPRPAAGPAGADRGDRMVEMLQRFQERSRKPVVLVQGSGTTETSIAETRAYLVEKGLPLWPSYLRGAWALRRFVDYHRFRTSVAEE